LLCKTLFRCFPQFQSSAARHSPQYGRDTQPVHWYTRLDAANAAALRVKNLQLNCPCEETDTAAVTSKLSILPTSVGKLHPDARALLPAPPAAACVDFQLGARQLAPPHPTARSTSTMCAEVFVRCDCTISGLVMALEVSFAATPQKPQNSCPIPFLKQILPLIVTV
jgi:hypothetical protein